MNLSYVPVWSRNYLVYNETPHNSILNVKGVMKWKKFQPKIKSMELLNLIKATS